MTNKYLKLEIRVVWREFIAFEYIFIIIFKTNQILIYIFVNQIFFNPTFKTGFLVHNNHLNLSGQVENSK